MDPLTIILAYLSLIPAILEPLFSYTAVKMGQRSQSIGDVHSEDSLNAYGSSLFNCFIYSDDKLIERDVTLTEEGIEISQKFTIGEEKHFKLHHPCYLIKSGIEYKVLAHLIFLVVRWICGPVPYPIPKQTIGFLKTCFPNSRLGIWLSGRGYQKAMLLNLCAYAPVIRFHNPENRPAANTICVANHTTPVDFAVLASDNTYAVVGQKQGGFFGLVERILSSAVPTIWFDRSEIFDRSAVAKRLREHVATPGAPPILIFPEGTCINNTSVMKFKKGCFEVGAVIHPVAIRYDPRYADCFWNSSQDSLFQYLLKMMSSWAMVVDVWYLPPERPLPGEDGIQFAARVKRIIAKQGGLTAMDWDGELKRSHPKPTLKLTQQKLFSEMIASED
ncbi:glycerol-3-phosphate acyltransferase [Sparganum proliferum]